MDDHTINPDNRDSSQMGTAEELLPLVYEELRRLAASKLARESPGQTLQPTALVHEAWVKLAGNDSRKFHGRTHFFATAAEAMRRILIDTARRKIAARHGGGQVHISADDVEIASPTKEEELLAVHDALDKLAAHNPPMADLVKLRFFVGLTNKECAETLELSEATVERWWAFARAWLFDAIRESKEEA